MKILCDKESLLESINSVQKAVTKRSTLPILNGILFYTDKDELLLKATDLEITIVNKSRAKVEKEGAVVIPARIIGDVVRSLPDKKIEIDTGKKDNKTTIRSGSALFNLNTLSPDDYPKIEKAETKKKIATKTKEFSSIAKKVIKSASSDDTRPILTGVLMSFNKGKIRMVSTDSYRLTIGEASYRDGGEEEAKAVVPSSAIQEITRSAKEKGDINIEIGENQAIFEYDRTTLITRLIEGQFPSYQKLIPEEFKLEFETKREDLLETISRVAVLAQNNAPIRISIEGKKLVASTLLAEVGEAREEINIEKEGEDLVVGYNANYFLDGINGVSDERIIIEITGPEKPSLIRGKKESDYLYLIMPVRL